ARLAFRPTAYLSLPRHLRPASFALDFRSPFCEIEMAGNPDHGGAVGLASNFAFLGVYDKRLATLGGLAERYFRDDPSTAIVKLRQFAELTARMIAARHGAYRDERETFEETLRRLAYERIIPREVADIFHALRKS